MDTGTLVLLILIGIYVVIFGGSILRELFFSKKEDMRNQRTEGLVSGKDVVERMLREANIEGISVVPQDAIIQRYYYSPRKKQIVISSHACYCSGYYEVMRAATTASNAIQREEGFGMIDFYLWLAPVMEWMARMLPMFLIVGVLLIEYSPMLVGVSLVAIWALMLILALLMRPVDKDAAKRSIDWLISNGVVAESNRARLEKIGRYLTNYNLMLVISSGFAIFFLRSKMYWPSDKSV